jgi:hypothetical protein
MLSGNEMGCSNLNSEDSKIGWKTILETADLTLTGKYPLGIDNLMVRNVG